MIGTGLELKAIFFTIKYIALFVFVWLGFDPLYDMTLLQVQDYVFLSPHWKEFLSEMKYVLGFFAALLTVMILVRKLYKKEK